MNVGARRMPDRAIWGGGEQRERAIISWLKLPGALMSSKYDRDVRLAKRVTLNVAAIYLATFKRADDGGNFQAAKTLLEKHNIGQNVGRVRELRPRSGERSYDTVSRNSQRRE
jgi:hypothetical protein